MKIRELRFDEVDLLRHFLYQAIFIPDGIEPPNQDIIEQRELRIYYEDFTNGPADYGLVADDDGKVIGAVWTRIMKGYGHVDDETPSLAVSLDEDYRGQGIEMQLMEAMLALLKEEGYKQVSLAVQKANYAVRLYEKTGFKTVKENEDEYIMVCRL